MSRKSVIEVFGTSGNDNIVGSGKNEDIYGGAGNDVIDGGGGFDFVYGGDGNDTLTGGRGKYENLYGGAGDDVLIASKGNDALYGGEGADTFVFDTGEFSKTFEYDNIRDLNFAEGDVVVIDETEIHSIAEFKAYADATDGWSLIYHEPDVYGQFLRFSFGGPSDYQMYVHVIADL